MTRVKKILRALPRTWHIALVVGSILTIINQWDMLWSRGLRLGDCPRIFMNFMVPWLVSAYSRATAGKQP